MKSDNNIKTFCIFIDILINVDFKPKKQKQKPFYDPEIHVVRFI